MCCSGSPPEWLGDPPERLSSPSQRLGGTLTWLDSPLGWLDCVVQVAVDVFLWPEVWFQDDSFDLIQVREVVVSVVKNHIMIFHEGLLQFLIDAYEGTEVVCCQQIYLIPYFL
jgi:hypothetical protein